MTNRFKFLLAVCVAPMALTGCALQTASDPTATTPPATAAIATQVAEAVAATISARVGTGSPAPVAGTRTPTTPAVTPTGAAVNAGAATAHTATPSSNLANVPASSTPTLPPSATPSPAATFTPSPVPTPILLAPTNLAEREIGGGKLLPRYWTNTSAVVITVAAPPGVTLGLRPQIELQPLDKPFDGMPTAEGQALPASQIGEITVDVAKLPEGAYHWRARLTDGKYRGPWATYYDGPAFRLDRTPPSTVVISSTTYPDQRQTYNRVIANFTWTAATDNGAVQGYQTGIDRKPNGLPAGPISDIRHADLGPLANGNLYFHVRAVDWAGNFGPVATYAVHIDNTAPLIEHAYFSRFQFNPQYDKLSMRFTPNKLVHVRAVIRRQTTKGVVRELDLGEAVAGTPFNITWDGRNYRGLPVQPGLYTMAIQVTDKLGNVGEGLYTDLGINYRRIVVHLATQHMDVFDGTTLLRSTLVTTGNALLPTPVGIWHIGAKFHPYRFISPWKKGNQYYYPPSSVQYALYFHAGGYFIHDAPWRTVYGPGTNTAPGPPGIYSGTHGCINVPGDVEKWLYKWATIGTVVQVEQ
jgi:L,D-transpeptidase catalytic domain